MGQCDASNNGYHCTEVTYNILGAWQKAHISIGALEKMHVFISVSQEPPSQFGWAIHLEASEAAEGQSCKD